MSKESQNTSTHSPFLLAKNLAFAGSKNGGRIKEWSKAANDMKPHCIGGEDVTEAALRVVIDEYNSILKALQHERELQHTCAQKANQ